MNKPLNSRSLERAHWLNEITLALEEADRLLTLVEGQGKGRTAETNSLRLRIEIVRAELASFNRVDQTGSRLVDAVWPVVEATAYTPSGNSPPPPNGSRNDPIGGASQPAVAQKPGLRKAFLP